MATTAPARFLNLDLEATSQTDLLPLAKHLSTRTMILLCEADESGSRIALEPKLGGRLSSDPVACTEHLLHALETLPTELATLWQSCTLRVFDYGFDGGLESPPHSIDLSASALYRMAALQLDFRITIYPFRADSVDEVAI